MRSTGGGARFGVCAIAGDERSTSAKAAFFISTSRSAYYIIVLPYCILLTGTVGVHSLVEAIRNAKADLEIIMADSQKQGRPKNAVIAGEKGIQRGPAQKEGQPMEETIPFPQESSKPLEQETAEFLELLLRIGFELEEQDAE